MIFMMWCRLVISFVGEMLLDAVKVVAVLRSRVCVDVGMLCVVVLVLTLAFGLLKVVEMLLLLLLLKLAVGLLNVALVLLRVVFMLFLLDVVLLLLLQTASTFRVDGFGCLV